VADLVLRDRVARPGDSIVWKNRLWVCFKKNEVYTAWRPQ
jgi:hypothetical protein